jgi:5-formyltetrahydrofolate cyclo-ligase
MSAAMREAKRALRDALTGARDALDPGFRARASRAIASRIEALAAYREAHVVLLTLPYRSEWDAMLLVRAALAAGKVVGAPRVDTTARMLQPLRIADAIGDVEPGYRGIPEPRADCAPVVLESVDWVLVPGIAFDEAGRRLGYGGGYYDRLLPLLPPAAARVAGAFEAQIVAEVPAAAHDAAVDWIVTEERLIRCVRAPA